MTDLISNTSFSAAMIRAMDQHCRALDVVIVSASFEARPGAPLHLADDQFPVRDSDEHYGAPGSSSIRYEGETAWEKPLTDVIINGSAVAPRHRRVESVFVHVSVGDVQKTLRVSGDRHWRLGLRGMVPSSPEPFEHMPILYERAFGGMSESRRPRAETRNLVGLGFKGARPPNPEIETEVPNIEYPKGLVKSRRSRPHPAGLGVIGRNWQPRLGFAGTYDDKWLKEQCPLVPLDFDTRHFQSSAADQQSRGLRGGEAVRIENMTPEGLWEFSLPTLDVPVRLIYGGRKRTASLKLDTVLIEPDHYRVTLIARACAPLSRKWGPLVEVIVGHVSRGWWRAHVKGKTFLGAAEHASSATPDFHT